MRTSEGKIYQGQIRFENNGLVIANAAQGHVVPVALTNLWTLSFKTEATTRTEEDVHEMGALPRPWQNADVGRAEISGSAKSTSGLFRLSTSGTNIVGESDAFHFVYRAIAGDSEIVARVVYAPRAAPGAKAGLMMRENLRSDSRNVFLGVTPVGGGVFQWREHEAQDTAVTNRGDMCVPQWLKLRRQGDSFSGYKSRNGRQWGLIGKLSLSMTRDAYVGLAMAAIQGGTGLDSAEAKVSFCTIDNVRAASPSIPITSFVPRVALQSGSMIMGPIEWADDKAIHFPPEQLREPIPAWAVSGIFFQWVPYRFNSVFKAGRPGVLLTNGQFVDGDFKAFENSRVQLSSVLFGLRHFDVNHEVLGVVLRKPVLDRPEFEVKTTDGSVWLGTALKFSPNQIMMREAALGSHRIPVHELQEVRRTR